MKVIKKKVIETPCTKMWMDGEIIFIEFLPVNPTLEEAKEHIRILKEEFADYLPALAISDIRPIKQSRKEVRNYFAGTETAAAFKAMGLLTNSTVSRLTGNLFLNLSKPKYPTRIFSNEQKAREWLLSME